MGTRKKIETDEIKKVLLDALDRRYGKQDNYKNMVHIADDIDNFVEEYLINLIFQYHMGIFGPAKVYKDKKDKYLVQNGLSYPIGICKKAGYKKIAVLEILAMDDGGKALPSERPMYVDISTFGRYERIEVSYNIRLDAEILTLMVSTVFETAYKWFLDEKLKTLLDREGVSMRSEIYDRVRTHLQSDELSSKIWFGAINLKEKSDQGVYLFDYEHVKCSLESVKGGAANVVSNPYKIISEFINTTLPYEKMMAKEAINSNLSNFDVELENALYRDEQNLYALSEYDIYGSKSITIYPLIKEGQMRLIACFPQTVKSLVVPVLDSQKEALAERFKASGKKVQRILKMLKQKYSSPAPAEVGEFSAAFLVQLIKNLYGGV